MKYRQERYPLDSNFLETRGFRPEIQGLRALAVFLVVLYHIWFGRVSGGVDVFLFISAFLLSLSSMRKINEGKPLAPVKYWLHVFQRLLPAASVVILLTVVASFFIYAPSRMAGIIKDAFATIFYYQNWHLAFSSVDYYANNAAAKTPLQHFWSLSMQGQIFLTWPLLFVLVALLARKLRFNIIGSAVLIFGTVWAASLTFSVIETYSNQGFAYFDTRTRLWEFASGTLLAILTFKWAPPQKLRVAMGWIGVLGLATCGFLLPVQQAFPGYLALWPLLSGALVILAGRTGSPYGVDRLLTSKPLLKLGESSYALYLVHWPLFILYASATDKVRVNFAEGSVLILVSIVLAYLLHTYVEQPVRTLEKKPVAGKLPQQSTKPKRAWTLPLATIATCVALVTLPLSGASVFIQRQEKEAALLSNSAGSEEYPGALVAGQRPVSYDRKPMPEGDPVNQFDSLPGSCESEYKVLTSALSDSCGYQNFGDSPDAPLTIVIGDSHAEQALAMYRPIAEEHGLRVASYLSGGCHFPMTSDIREDCVAFSQNGIEEVLQQKPENVVMMLTMANPTTNEEKPIPGVEDVVQRFTDEGIKVIGLRDNPRFDYNMYECAQTSLDNLSACSRPLDTKLAASNPAQGLIDSDPNVYGIDLTELYCPNGVCEPVIGNIYVFLDDNHITKAYATTTAQDAYRQLTEAGWSPTI